MLWDGGGGGGGDGGGGCGGGGGDNLRKQKHCLLRLYLMSYAQRAPSLFTLILVPGIDAEKYTQCVQTGFSTGY